MQLQFAICNFQFAPKIKSNHVTKIEPKNKVHFLTSKILLPFENHANSKCPFEWLGANEQASARSTQSIGCSSRTFNDETDEPVSLHFVCANNQLEAERIELLLKLFANLVTNARTNSLAMHGFD